MDVLERAKNAQSEAESFWGEQHARMREDLAFSNPANPQQWDAGALNARRGGKSPRPSEVFDFTNMNIMQVVNDYRNNKVSPSLLPVGQSDAKSAKAMEGLLRYIDYASRSHIADETALESAARTGLGFTRVVTEVIDEELNLQEIKIKRVHDPMTVLMSPDSTEPDGSDMSECHIKTAMSKRVFEDEFPDSDLGRSTGSSSSDLSKVSSIDIVEYFYLEDTKQNVVVFEGPGGLMELPEDDYWRMVKETGQKPLVRDTRKRNKRVVKWIKYAGDEVLSETTFPGKFIPVIPLIGYELFVDGIRYLCGIPRRQRGAQVAYNYARNSEIEMCMASPKSPWLVGKKAIAGLEDQWDKANQGNPAYLVYNETGFDGQPNARPDRIHPPSVSPGFVELSRSALMDGERSIGLFASNLGMASNETSGKAINARARQGSIGNYHYMDGASRSLEQRTRIIMSMIPEVYDTKRVGTILRDDGSSQPVTINPTASSAYKKNATGAVELNPNSGTYEIRVKMGPGFATMRQEASEMLTEIMRSNPAFAMAVAPIWAENQDWPGADQVKRAMMAIAPPEVQKAIAGDADLPAEATAIINGIQQEAGGQMEQLAGMMQNMESEIQRLSKELEAANSAALQLKEQLASDQEKNAIKAQEIQGDMFFKGEEVRLEEERIYTERMKIMAENQDRIRQEAEVVHEEKSTEHLNALTEAVMMLAQKAQEPTTPVTEALVAAMTKPKVMRIQCDDAGNVVGAVMVTED